MPPRHPSLDNLLDTNRHHLVRLHRVVPKEIANTNYLLEPSELPLSPIAVASISGLEYVESEHRLVVTQAPPLAKVQAHHFLTFRFVFQANLLVEYPIDEAIELLTSNQQSAKSKVEFFEQGIQFLQEQIVVMQVSMARIHNWAVVARRQGRIPTQ